MGHLTFYILSPNFETFKEPKNQFQGINPPAYSLAGRYDNPIPTRFLASIDCLKIPALFCTLGLVQEPSSQVEETGEGEEGEHIAAIRFKRALSRDTVNLFCK